MQRKGNNRKKIPQLNRPRNKSKQQHEKILELSLIKTYPNQVVWETWLPALPRKLTTTVTSGVIANAYLVQASAINDFATRFGATFVEYRIIRAKFALRFFSSTNPGIISIWFDEQSNAAPTLLEAEERAIDTLSASSIDTRPVFRWTCADPLDLQYASTAGGRVPVTFKVYTNNANFGSSVVATDYCEVVPHLQFQFRGLLGD
jgi:hypothetical protein